MNKPLVSIVMNCFNGEKFLKRALKSIINQRYYNWELIFWDNLSTDQSKNIFLSFDDKRLKYFCSKNLRNFMMQEMMLWKNVMVNIFHF